MTRPQALNLTADPADLTIAAQLLSDGELVAFPTETVYGLGADARNAKAVAGIFAAKNRPSFNPLIVHVASIEAAGGYVEWSDTAEQLAQAFWPGPLTLVAPLKAGHGLCPLVTAGLDTLAIRVPAHPAARALLAQFDGPVAAPSANPSGRISPTTAAHVQSGLGNRIAAIVDDGACSVGLESTIIGLSPRPILLRDGGVSREKIETALGYPLATRDPVAPLNAPGQMQSHYAPNAKLRINVETPDPSELFLGFGEMDCDLNLSARGDLTEAAAHLFDHLHRLDHKSRPIAVAPIPDCGLGRAINDRLRRAAAPRDADGQQP